MSKHCNAERFAEPPACPHCGPPRGASSADVDDEIEPVRRATCEDSAEASDGEDAHGPQFSHWTCPNCERYFTLERMITTDIRRLS